MLGEMNPLADLCGIQAPRHYIAIDHITCSMPMLHAHAFQMRIVSMQQIALRRMVYEMLEPSGALLLSQPFSSCMPNLLIPTLS